MSLFASYDRNGVEIVIDNFIGQRNFDHIITNELLVVAYDYNSQEPRFFSKFFKKEDAGTYNVTLGDAAAASAAAPVYFDPKVQRD